MSRIPHNTDLLKQLMENITDHIFFKDTESRFILLNQADAKWLGFQSPEEVIGKNDFDLFTADFAQVARDDEVSLMDTGVPLVSKEERETWPDGSVTWVSTTKAPLKDKDGNVVGCIGIGRDITEMKNKEFQLEEANRKLKAVNDQISEDLRMAAQLQQTFLPHSYPAFTAPDGQPRIHFSHYYESDIEIGGDYCAVYKLSETTAGLFICDVMGHGVRAALITSMVNTLAERQARKATSPGDFLTRMNRPLNEMLQTEENFLFATACYITIDTERGELQGALAGHDAPLLLSRHDGTVRPLSASENQVGPALAVTPDFPYTTFRTPLNSGDKIVLYTDGICEAMNEAEEEFGQEHLCRTIAQFSDLPIDELLPAIVKEVRQFSDNNSLGDDICLLGFALQ